MVSLNYTDRFTNLILDFAIKLNDKMRVKIGNFKNQFYHTSDMSKRKRKFNNSIQSYSGKRDGRSYKKMVAICKSTWAIITAKVYK